MVEIKNEGNHNIETLISLADYFRRALNDEIKLPETSVTMPQLVQVKGTAMMQINAKTSHYRSVLNTIEGTLEKHVNFLVEKSNESPARKSSPVVDAQTSLTFPKKKISEEDQGKVKEEDKVKKLMPSKKTIEGKEVLNSLLDLPKELLTDVFKDTLTKEWEDSKGNESKAKLYTKVKDLLNNQKLSIADVRQIISKFSQQVKKEQYIANEATFLEEIKKEGIDFKINTPLDSLINGKELLNGKTQFTANGEFNLLLLSGKDNVDNVSPQDYVKQRAMYLRVVGKEINAIDELTKFYSDADKGIIWSLEKTRWFLNNLFATNSFKHLQKLIENILVYKQENGKSYKEGLKQAKNLMRSYTRYEVKDAGNKTKHKAWEDHKINSFLDKVILKLTDSGILTPIKEISKETSVKTSPKQESKKTEDSKTEIVFKIDVEKTEDDKFSGKLIGNGMNVSIMKYNLFEDFKKAVKILTDSQIKAFTKNGKAPEARIKYNFKKVVKGNLKKHDKAEKTLPTNKVDIPPKSGTSGDNKKHPETKTIEVVKKEAFKGTDSTERFKKSAAEKEALKQAKKGIHKAPTTSPTAPKSNLSEKPEYSAIITKEKDGTFTCVLNGFNEAVKTTGSKTMELAKTDFVVALLKYSQKIKEENDKAKASYTKGKKIHMKPDFSNGDLVFLMRKTGTDS